MAGAGEGAGAADGATVRQTAVNETRAETGSDQEKTETHVKYGNTHESMLKRIMSRADEGKDGACDRSPIVLASEVTVLGRVAVTPSEM